MEFAKYEMCRIRNVQKIDSAQFGTCNVQKMEQEHTKNGMCKRWNVQKMEWASYEMCKKWKVQNVECAKFGPCKL